MNTVCPPQLPERRRRVHLVRRRTFTAGFGQVRRRVLICERMVRLSVGRSLSCSQLSGASSHPSTLDTDFHPPLVWLAAPRESNSRTVAELRSKRRSAASTSSGMSREEIDKYVEIVKAEVDSVAKAREARLKPLTEEQVAAYGDNVPYGTNVYGACRPNTFLTQSTRHLAIAPSPSRP